MELACTACNQPVPRTPGRQYPPPEGCPRCGSTSGYSMFLTDRVPAPTDALLLHAKSTADLSETLLVVTADGRESRHDVRATAAGLESQRRTRHSERYRAAKIDEELDAARLLLPAFNAAFGTRYVSVEGEQVQDHPVDVWAVGPGEARQGIQVTKPDREVWKDLAQRAAHDHTESEAAMLSRIADTVATVKRYSGSPDIVLVLDGWGVFAAGAIERLRARHHAELAALNFHSVWLCNRGPGAPVVRVDVAGGSP